MPKFRSRSDGTHYPLTGSRTMKGARRSRRYKGSPMETKPADIGQVSLSPVYHSPTYSNICEGCGEETQVGDEIQLGRVRNTWIAGHFHVKCQDKAIQSLMEKAGFKA